LHCILRVEVPDGSYTLVPTDLNERAGGEVHYITVEQDPGQSPEVCLTACANEGKPRFYHQPMFYLNLCNYLCYSMCIYIQELNETLVA
jgi:hypothetical protein